MSDDAYARGQMALGFWFGLMGLACAVFPEDAEKERPDDRTARPHACVEGAERK